MSAPLFSAFQLCRSFAAARTLPEETALSFRLVILPCLLMVAVVVLMVLAVVLVERCCAAQTLAMW